jgi:hypothetical protein
LISAGIDSAVVAQDSRVVVGMLRVSVTMVVLASLGSEARAQDKPVFAMRSDKGFIDDPFAVDAETNRLALLRTDSASFAALEIIDLGTRKVTQAFRVGDPHALFDRVLFAGPKGGLVVITRHPSTGQRTAQLFGPDGKAAGAIGPATDFATSSRGAVSTLVAWDRKTAATGETAYVVSQHRLDTLARLGTSRSWTIGKDGALKSPPLNVITWQEGYTQIVGQKPGAYDAKKDVRLPGKGAVLDAFSGAFLSEFEIGDVTAWTVVSQLRRTRVNRTLLAVINDERDAISVVDASGRRSPLTLPVPMRNYDPKSLAEQEAANRTLYFGLSLDPLNPEALGRQRADKPFFDLYRVRVSGDSVDTTRLLHVAIDERPVAWKVSGTLAAVLKKHKSFSRGGSEIEVYTVGER